MDISVVVPAYNSSRFIEAALESVAAQSLAPREIIVVDDGSTDDTLERVQLLQAKTKLTITLLKQTNQGVSVARNHGIRVATGDWIALLDADDIWVPEHLTMLAKAVTAYPHLAAVFGDGVYFDSEKKEESQPYARPKALRAVEKVHDEEVYLLGAKFYEVLLPGLFFPPSSFMFNRTLAVNVGLFDESLKASEDREFILRLSRFGGVAFVDRALAKIRIHGGNLSHPRNATRNNYFALKALTKILDRSLELHLSAHEVKLTRSELQRAGAKLLYSASIEGLVPYLMAFNHLLGSRAFGLQALHPIHLLRAIRYSFK